MENGHRDLDAIRNALQRFANGATMGDLLSSGIDLKLRTLQRRLDELRKLGEVTFTGNTRARVYRLIDKDTADAAQQGVIPLSLEGRSILAKVSKPIQYRKIVGYNREFPDSYRPNIDSYLTPTEKLKLAQLGDTRRNDQPAGTYAKEVMNRLLIDLSWNSSRLEGNTYSLLDTERLIALGDTSMGNSPAEAQMILNHKDAIEFLIRNANEIGFNRYTFLNLHAILANNLLSNPEACGRLRTIEVRIGQSVYIPPAVPQFIKEMFESILDKAARIENPFEQAFFIMVHLPYLQPFDDVNKRVSRLAANISLVRSNLAPLSFVDVPNGIYVHGITGVYELNRIDLLKDVFMWAYERSSTRYAVVRQSLGEPDPFRLKYREEIRSLIGEILSNAMSRDEASAALQKRAESIELQDRAQFEAAVASELLGLHEGNFARYWVSPAQFKLWMDGWHRGSFDRPTHP